MIKKWSDFIKETKQLNLFQDTEWDTDETELIYLNMYPITEEDIQDYLLEIEEAGYGIDIQFGFNDDGSFDKKINSYKIKTAIGITIVNNDPNHEDVTSCLRSTINKLKRFFKEISIHDDESKIDIKDLVINNGIFIKTEEPEPEDLLSIEGSLFILFKSDKDIQITDKIICEYYQFKDDIIYDEKENAKVAFARDRLSDLVVKNRDPYKNIIDSPDYEMDWNLYDSTDYIPEHDSFFKYYLENETIRMMLEYCFKDWDELKEEYHDSFISDYETKEELIEDIITPKERYSNSRKNCGKFLYETEIGNNIYNELREMYGDWSAHSKADDDYEKIMEAFDKIVEDNLNTEIVEEFSKESPTKYKNKQGEWVEKTYERPYYRLSFNLDWIKDQDPDNLFNSEIDDSIYANDWEKSDIKPWFDDYPHVDDVSFNTEARAMIQKLIKGSNNS
jgi:hypothetical protein